MRKVGYDYPDNSGPIFTDVVYSTRSINNVYSNPKDFIYYFKGFRAGDPTFDYPPVTMPSNKYDIDAATISNSIDISNFNNIKYSHIFLKGDKIKLSQDAIEDNDTKDPIINLTLLNNKNNLLYNSNKSNNIYVKGDFSDRLTIASEGNVYAAGDILYTKVKNNLSSFTNNCIFGTYTELENTTSMIGILSNNFIIQSNTENKNKNNVVITASIYATNQIKIIENSMTDYKWTNNKPRYFIVYGGRTQGSLQSSTYSEINRMGLREVLIYDRRLKQISPPCAPYTDKGARISYWDERMGKVKK